MGGWTKDDLHEFFLIDHFGENLKLFGKKRLKPMRRSSRLNKMEFADFVHLRTARGKRRLYSGR